MNRPVPEIDERMTPLYQRIGQHLAKAQQFGYAFAKFDDEYGMCGDNSAYSAGKNLAQADAHMMLFRAFQRLVAIDERAAHEWIYQILHSVPSREIPDYIPESMRMRPPSMEPRTRAEKLETPMDYFIRNSRKGVAGAARPRGGGLR